MVWHGRGAAPAPPVVMDEPPWWVSMMIPTGTMRYVLIFLAILLALDLVRRFFFLQRVAFANKHVLVTGGSQGIGRALAARLLERGARVTLLARTEAKLKLAANELREAEIARRAKKGLAGGEVSVQYVCADQTNWAQLTSAVTRASDTYGPPDCLFACAGGALPGLFLHTPIEEYAKAMDLNYMGTIRAIKAVLEPMVRRRRGHIIIVGSALSVVGFMGYSTYAPTKHALRGLADVLRNELVGFNITVHMAYPPDTETPGFTHENETKPVETAAMVPVDVFSADAVAEKMVRGVEGGLYHLFAPDPVINAMISAASGVTPRAYPLLESVVLVPIASLIEAAATVYFDVWGRRYAARHAKEQALKEMQ